MIKNISTNEIRVCFTCDKSDIDDRGVTDEEIIQNDLNSEKPETKE